ncbi:hypothetical protein CUJ83_07345 [Methanocella sp. CWC-04]|uniref:Uncharacterized protein n=2 Tax=Methanooceanicella nereidis TaxID=2052831 RepID=A0AAP2REQ1_9EURY|nr:hypothetical protein [Methanocella sp. CWC-04]
MIFTAICIGVNSFENTASSDSSYASATRIAAYVSDLISDAVLCAGEDNGEMSVEIELPERINGMTYMVYPSEDGKRILVRINSPGLEKEYGYPLITASDSLKLSGSVISYPKGHMIRIDPAAGSVTIS